MKMPVDTDAFGYNLAKPQYRSPQLFYGSAKNVLSECIHLLQVHSQCPAGKT